MLHLGFLLETGGVLMIGLKSYESQTWSPLYVILLNLKKFTYVHVFVNMNSKTSFPSLSTFSNWLLMPFVLLMPLIAIQCYNVELTFCVFSN